MPIEAYFLLTCEDNVFDAFSFLLLTDQYLYILRNTEQSGKMVIKARRKVSFYLKVLFLRSGGQACSPTKNHYQSPHLWVIELKVWKPWSYLCIIIAPSWWTLISESQTLIHNQSTVFSLQLNTIMKITTKAKMADVVKIQYGSKGTDGSVHITDTDRLHIPKKSGRSLANCTWELCALEHPEFNRLRCWVDW